MLFPVGYFLLWTSKSGTKVLFFFVNLDETHCSQTAGQNPICKMCLISQVYHKNFPFSDMSSASAEQITRLSLNQRIWAGFSTFQLWRRLVSRSIWLPCKIHVLCDLPYLSRAWIGYVSGYVGSSNPIAVSLPNGLRCQLLCMSVRGM